jgi:hypothetical protein
VVAKKCHTNKTANKTENNICCPLIPGTLFLCGQSIYPCLPQSWKHICTLVFLVPDMNIITEDQDLIPLTTHLRSKRAIQTIPLFATPGHNGCHGNRGCRNRNLCPLLHKTL